MESTTRSASAVRALNSALRDDWAAAPRARRSAPVACRSTGHDNQVSPGTPRSSPSTSPPRANTRRSGTHTPDLRTGRLEPRLVHGGVPRLVTGPVFKTGVAEHLGQAG